MLRIIAIHILFAAVSLMGEYSVKFKSEVSISGPEIRMKDISGIDGPKTDLKEELADLSVGRAPVPGYSREIETAVLKDIVKQKYPDQVEFLTGPYSVNVRTEADFINAVELRIKLEDYIYRSSGMPPEDLIINSIKVPERVRVSSRPREIRITSDRNCDFKGVESFGISIVQDGRETKNFTATARIRVFSDACFAARKIKRGSYVKPEDIVVRKTEITSYNVTPVSDPQNLAGRIASRTIGEGRVLSRSYFEFPADIERNDNVALSVKSGSVVLRVNAVAREDGRIGDEIWVKNLVSNRLQRAKVLSDKLVELD
ncbi:MAG: flagellar basal body P-ring formation chaperone FlgA [Fibrobacterota bacterium]